MKLKIQFIVCLLALAIVSCHQSTEKDGTTEADIIYFGGDILTMEGDSAQYAEAAVVKNGKRVF